MADESKDEKKARDDLDKVGKELLKEAEANKKDIKKAEKLAKQLERELEG